MYDELKGEHTDVKSLIFIWGSSRVLDVPCLFFSAMTSAVPQGDSAPESCPNALISSSLLGGICVSDRPSLWASKGERKNLKKNSNRSVTFGSNLSHMGLCHEMKSALLCNLSAQLTCPWGLSWEMEASVSSRKRLGIASFRPAKCAGCRVIALLVVWIHKAGTHVNSSGELVSVS